MPRIPFGIADPQLPATSGRRGGVVQTPVVQEPMLDSDAATLPGRAVAEFGGQVAQTGQYLQQAEAYQFQRQRAQDVLDAKSQLQEYRQQLLTTYDGLTQGDYRTLPEDTLKEGKKLIENLGRGLTPQARALFQEDANQALTAVQQSALAERTKRRDQATAYTLSREVQQVQELMLRTMDPYQQEVLLGQLDDLSRQFVNTGLVRGEAMADVRKKTLDAIADQQVQRAIAANPDLMKQQLLAQIQGESTQEGWPLARLETLPQLYQQAVQLSRTQFREREHDERYAHWKRSEQQADNSRELRAQIYTTPMTPASVATFEKILAQAALATRNGDLDETTGEHLMRTAQAHMATAAKPPVMQDDVETERTLALAIRAAERPEEFERVRTMLTDAGRGKLKPETFSSMYDKLEQREGAAQWRQFPEVRAAKDIIMRGALVPYGGTLAGQTKPQMQQQLTWAVDAWEAQLQGLFDDPQGGPRAVRKQASALAWENRRVMLRPDMADAQDYLPPDVQDARTPVELAEKIHALRMLGWSAGSLLIIRDNWHRWQDGVREGRPASGTGQPPRPAAPPGPASYQLPGGTDSPAGPRSR